MEPSLQAKLLKALEEKAVRRLGGSQAIPFDVRIVAAINEPPQKLLDSGRLRADLYYRLGVVRLSLPPLRERAEDIPLLTSYFIEQFNRSMKRQIRGITPGVADFFRRYSWPGNIRQLRNAVEGSFAVAQGELLSEGDLVERSSGWPGLPEDLAPPAEEAVPPEGEPISLTQAVERYEKELIRQAMARWGSISAAARNLGLSRQNLKYKLKKFDL